MQINRHYEDLTESYLFSTIAHKVSAFQQAHPEADIIRLGIDDATRPPAPAVIRALHAAVDDQGRQEPLRGYGPAQGDALLQQAV